VRCAQCTAERISGLTTILIVNAMNTSNPKPNRTYRDLDAWKHGKNLVKHVYLLSKKLPDDERFGLTQQIRRAAISIPSNIAQGVGRNHDKDVIQFLYISRGSLYETETLASIAFDLEYITENELNSLLEKTEMSGKLLNGFVNYYESKPVKSRNHF
jgi:four helix bundle protein